MIGRERKNRPSPCLSLVIVSNTDANFRTFKISSLITHSFAIRSLINSICGIFSDVCRMLNRASASSFLLKIIVCATDASPFHPHIRILYLVYDILNSPLSLSTLCRYSLDPAKLLALLLRSALQGFSASVYPDRRNVCITSNFPMCFHCSAAEFVPFFDCVNHIE